MADHEQVRSEDAFGWALRVLAAAAQEPTFDLAERAVMAMLERRSEAELREVAGALALLPRLASRPLTQLAEVDRVALEFQWEYSR